MKTTIIVVTILVAVAQAAAQEYKFGETQVGGYGRGTLSITKSGSGQLVMGSFYGDKFLICNISGTYYPLTGRVKGWCKDSTGRNLHAVTGSKLKNTDGFQLSIGEKSTYVAYRSDTGVSGKWRIQQSGGGKTYYGNLVLKQDGVQLTGTAEWDNHQRGTISGQLYENDAVSFTIDYGDGLKGYYRATLGKNGEDMVGGTAKANKSEAVVSWFAKRTAK